ncbi:dTDP-4-dehydrorhamnose reductase [Membranihabitans marinus]|uniref:dTDP-4-dehydrorhamnose reductase n=1 Tax=Membranihabitans marinus TaxID=1227546 RepID=UPI001EFFEA5F|nr:dTDP-4-dehydrorhamnose reductase [Membranihabitans marinus]
MIKIGVLGSQGQLGKELYDLHNDHPEIKWTFFDRKTIDITDEASIGQLSSYDLDYIVNAAAYTAVDAAEDEEEKAFAVNAEGVKYLAQYCKEAGITLIHVSTDYVYGVSDKPIIEDGVIKPINIYGKSKQRGEDYVQTIEPHYFIVRTSWLYSSYGKNFVKTMMRLAQSRNEISVVSDQVGSPTFAGDLAKAIVALIETDNRFPMDSDIFNYANLGSITWWEFAKAILAEDYPHCKVLPITSAEYSTKAQRSSYSVLDSSKITAKCPSVQILPWKDSLSICLDQIRQSKSK